uniref:RHS repeat-associated core domain-containing protein n=1 Tax=Steinernema glaseri TaxID=37863 RepID=A0A1I7YHA7_9BILA
MVTCVFQGQEGRIVEHVALNHPVGPNHDIRYSRDGSVRLGHYDPAGQGVRANFWYLIDSVRWQWSTGSWFRGMMNRYRVKVENLSKETWLLWLLASFKDKKEELLST